MNEKLVTLITPCYNAEKFLGRFLDSVLAQTYKNIQFILVNDGSTDRTDEIIRTYTGALNASLHEFKYIVKENGGPGSAVNAALKYTEGEYLSWADSDDYLYPENIRSKVNYLDAHDECGLVACNAEAINFTTGKKIRELKFTIGGGANFYLEKCFLVTAFLVILACSWLERNFCSQGCFTRGAYIISQM